MDKAFIIPIEPASLAKQLGGTSKALEFCYVAWGLKPACRVIVASERATSVAVIVKQQGIAFEIGSEVMLAPSSPDNPYLTKGMLKSHDDVSMTAVAKTHSYRLCYLARDAQTAIRLMEAEELLDHAQMGALLGYPPCCVSSFSKHAPVESKGMFDFVLPALKNSSAGGGEGRQAFPSLLNVFIRSFDMHLISHAPCSFSCARSLAQAKERLARLEQSGASVALVARMRSLLGFDALYTQHGVVFLREEQGSAQGQKEQGSASRNASRVTALATPYPTELSESIRQELAKGRTRLTVSQLSSSTNFGHTVRIGDFSVEGEIIRFA